MHPAPPRLRPRGLAALILLALAAPASAQTITVSNAATLAVENGAVLDLHGATLDFGATGTLAEASGGRVTGGLLTATRTLNAPSNANVAGLGATITSAANLGVTAVTRGHTAQAAGGSSVLRYFDVAPATNAGLNATLAFRYHEAELAGLAEAALRLWRSTDGGASYVYRGGTADPAANTVTLGGIAAFSRWTLGGVGFTTLAAKVFLQGPYNAGAANMNAALSAVLPTTNPYGVTGSVASPTFFTSDPNGQQVVDWVLVRLLSGTPGTTLALAAERPGLLLRDGRIVGPDGASPLGFPGVAAGDYHVVVRHRNHLAVMSAAAVSFAGGSGTYDFTTAQARAFGANPMREVAAGVFALVAGDGNGSGDVSAADRNTVWRAQNGLAGYRSADYNLSADVSAADRNTFWRPNNGRATQVPAGF